MALLFTIETAGVRLAWSQARPKPPPVAPAAGGPPFGLRVEPLGPGLAPTTTRGTDGPPHLFEQTDYTLFVRSRDGGAVRLRHRDPGVLRGLHRAEDGQVLHGLVNFGAQVGRSRFVVEHAGRPAFAFSVEVVPSKLDYRADYAALTDDVNAIAHELAFAYLRPALQPAHLAEAPPGPVAFATLLRHLLDDLEAALGFVAAYPHRDTRRAAGPVRAERLVRPDAAVRRAVARGQGRGPVYTLAGDLPVHAHLPARPAAYTLDTPAHRWLADRLGHLRRRLAALRQAEARRDRGRETLRRAATRAELDALARRLDRLLGLEPLRAAAGPPPPAPPLALLTAPGYREAYRACLALSRGLSLGGGPLGLGLKDLHLLYEYWCFLTLVRTAARVAGQPLPVAGLLAVEGEGLRLRMRQGHTQTVTFALDGGRRLALTYNPRFGGRGYLVPQRPDAVVTLHGPGTPPARFILDAKYRLDASPGYRQRYGVPGPPAEALNTLHRYRDAILDREARTVVQAVALYPYREAVPGAFAESRLARVLREVGVGAIPLLPGHTGYLAAWLRDLLV